MSGSVYKISITLSRIGGQYVTPPSTTLIYSHIVTLEAVGAKGSMNRALQFAIKSGFSCNKVDHTSHSIRNQLPENILSLDMIKWGITDVNILQVALVSDSASYREMEKEAERLKKKLEKVSGIKEAAGRYEPFWQFDINPNFGVASTDSYTLFDLGFGFDLSMAGQLISFNLVVKNMLDQDYRDFLDTYKGYALSPGRNVIFKLNIPFGIV